eukprot:1590656-Prymnesium_polylepis.1
MRAAAASGRRAGGARWCAVARGGTRWRGALRGGALLRQGCAVGALRFGALVAARLGGCAAAW